MIGDKHTTREAYNIGKKLGLSWNKIKPDVLKQGMDVEEEHNDNKPIDRVSPNIAKGDMTKVAKIAIAHIGEIPTYYDRLEKMEDEGHSKKGKEEEMENKKKVIIKKHLKK